MTFTQACKVCLREKYAVFSGRAPRSEYWWFVLFYLLAYIVAGTVSLGILDDSDSLAGLVVFVIVVLALIIPIVSVNVRRLHDLNRSGWWYLGFWVGTSVPFLQYLVAVGYLIYMTRPGTTGPNRFGADPLRPVWEPADRPLPPGGSPPPDAFPPPEKDDAGGRDFEMRPCEPARDPAGEPRDGLR